MQLKVNDLEPEMQRTVVMAAATLAAASLSTMAPHAQAVQVPGFFSLALDGILIKLDEQRRENPK